MTGNLWYNVNEKTNLCFFSWGRISFGRLEFQRFKGNFAKGGKRRMLHLENCGQKSAAADQLPHTVVWLLTRKKQG